MKTDMTVTIAITGAILATSLGIVYVLPTDSIEEDEVLSDGIFAIVLVSSWVLAFQSNDQSFRAWDGRVDENLVTKIFGASYISFVIFRMATFSSYYDFVTSIVMLIFSIVLYFVASPQSHLLLGISLQQTSNLFEKIMRVLITHGEEYLLVTVVTCVLSILLDFMFGTLVYYVLFENNRTTTFDSKLVVLIALLTTIIILLHSYSTFMSGFNHVTNSWTFWSLNKYYEYTGENPLYDTMRFFN